MRRGALQCEVPLGEVRGGLDCKCKSFTAGRLVVYRNYCDQLHVRAPADSARIAVPGDISWCTDVK